MNPYAMLASERGESPSSDLAARLAAWHDAMVAHERRLRTGRTGDVCDDECPHVEARTLWAEALAALGERAHELSFLRSRGTILAGPTPKAAAPPSTGAERGDNDNDQPPPHQRMRPARDPRGRMVIGPSRRSPRVSAEADL
jgi:hypothetical protein